jgi:hypothetical protein
MRNARTSQPFSPIKLDTPEPYQYRSLKPQSIGPIPPRSAYACVVASLSRPLHGRHEGESSNNADMTLADISDFSLRAKVAQTMEVATALSVRDLYHLVNDCKGQLPEARKEAIRMSEAPGIHRLSRKLSAPKPLGLAQDEDDDEILVKIDTNDPAFEWDTDEPSPLEPASKTKARAAKLINKRNKAKSLHNLFKSTKRTTSDSKRRSNTRVKRKRAAPWNPIHAKETSSDRDFVVADNVIHYILSDSDDEDSPDSFSRHKDSDIEMLDDLKIDMQPHYAFNADLLGGIRRRRK